MLICFLMMMMVIVRCMGGERRSTLRALQLCQTRAREAEKRSKKMADMLLRESVKLSAYKHWVKMLEIRVVVLENENENGKRLLFEHDDDDDVSVSWCYVLAICFGVAGMGFMLGRLF